MPVEWLWWRGGVQLWGIFDRECVAQGWQQQRRREGTYGGRPVPPGLALGICPHPRLWPLTVEARLAVGDLAGACVELLDTTEGQVDLWLAAKPTVADASALFHGINSVTRVAADLGE